MSTVRTGERLNWVSVVRPGDTLVVGLAAHAPMESLLRLRSKLLERLPDVEIMIINGVSQMVVYRPDDSGRCNVSTDPVGVPGRPEE